MLMLMLVFLIYLLADGALIRKEEDEEEVRYSYLVRREATAEMIDVNVVGDTLLINCKYVNDYQRERKDRTRKGI